MSSPTDLGVAEIVSTATIPNPSTVRSPDAGKVDPSN